MTNTAPTQGGTDKPAPTLVKIVAAPRLTDLQLLRLLTRICLLLPIALFAAILFWSAAAALLALLLAVLGLRVDLPATSYGR